MNIGGLVGALLPAFLLLALGYVARSPCACSICRRMRAAADRFVRRTQCKIERQHSDRLSCYWFTQRSLLSTEARETFSQRAVRQLDTNDRRKAAA